MSEIKYRNQLRPGDIGKIIALHGIIYSVEYDFSLTFEGYVAKSMGHFAEPFDETNERVWLVESDRELIGSIAIFRASDSQAQLRFFLVAPEYRGQQIGITLLTNAIDFATNVGYKSIYLDTVQGLHSAQRLYLAYGFQLTMQRPFFGWGKMLIEERYELRL